MMFIFFKNVDEKISDPTGVFHLDTDTDVSESVITIIVARVRISNVEAADEHLFVNKHGFLMISIEDLSPISIHKVAGTLSEHVITNYNSTGPLKRLSSEATCVRVQVIDNEHAADASVQRVDHLLKSHARN